MHPFDKRRRRLRKKLGLGRQDAFLVTNIVNVHYLTGFSGSSAWLLTGSKQDFLISDTRYQEQLADECPELELVIRDAKSTSLEMLRSTIESAGFHRLRFESESLTHSQFDQIQSGLPQVELIPSSQLVEELRSIKDRSEIELIRKSVKINQRAFEAIRAQLTASQTELQIAHNLEHQMRAFGATRCSFDPIVAVGPRSALPHAFPTSASVGDHPLLLIDWGAEYQHYASDLTRVLVTAKIPPKLRKIYEVVLAAQETAIKLIRPGVSLKKVDAAARGVIESAGYQKYFGHGLGHSFGLEIHESPFLSPIASGTLEAGMVVTVEPGIYLPGWGGIRIEDDILVTQNGYEVLSDLPKQLDDCIVDLS